MLRIVTIHHESKKFFDLQKKYFRKYTLENNHFYCGFTGFSLENHENYSAYNLNEISIHHADRLNYLMGFACAGANDSDKLIFIDSDAFPILPNWVAVVDANLNINPITAIQRRENLAPTNGCSPETHPHPCFFVTTVKFWKDNNLRFEVVPTAGYNIGEWLINKGLDFTKILRSNSVNLHPLYFGIYGNIIYHHGCGNRRVYDGIDICLRPNLNAGVATNLKFPNIVTFNDKLSNLVFDEIVKDDNFIKNYFMGII
jgi:hypothetical protein